MKLIHLPLKEFEVVAATTRLGEQACSMARAVLVDGRMQSDVATEWGMSKQRVNLAVNAIERAYIATASVENAIIRASFDLPESLALELGALLDAMKNCPDADLINSAIIKAIEGIRTAKKKLK